MSVALVTGSSGLIGSETVKHLSRKGLEVVGVDNDMRAYFFGKEASTAWNTAELKRQIPSFRHVEADIPLFAIPQVITPKFQSGIEGLKHWTSGGENKAWLRLNLPVDSKVLLLGDNEAYYLHPFRTEVHYESGEVDRLLLRATSPKEVGEVIRTLQFEFVVEFLKGPARSDETTRIAGAVAALDSSPMSGPGVIRIPSPATLRVWRVLQSPGGLRGAWA